MSQFGTISRQISRHNSSTTSSASMVSATGTYRRAPSVSSQQPHINGGPAYTQNSGLMHDLSECVTGMNKRFYMCKEKCYCQSVPVKDMNWSLLSANKKELLLVKSGSFEVSTVQCVIADSYWIMTLSRVNPEWQNAFQEGEMTGDPEQMHFSVQKSRIYLGRHSSAPLSSNGISQSSSVLWRRLCVLSGRWETMLPSWQGRDIK